MGYPRMTLWCPRAAQDEKIMVRLGARLPHLVRLRSFEGARLIRRSVTLNGVVRAGGLNDSSAIWGCYAMKFSVAPESGGRRLPFLYVQRGTYAPGSSIFGGHL